MIKLVAVDRKSGYSLLLRFSDGAWGEFDFADIVATRTEMTSPLAELDFFRRCFIELGALAWPNGFDLSAESLYRRLDDAGRLKRASEVAA